jgi:hypothetical protein
MQANGRIFVPTFKPRMGRKPLPPGTGKTTELPRIRISEEEKAIFEQKAQEKGLSFSEWVRSILTQACK